MDFLLSFFPRERNWLAEQPSSVQTFWLVRESDRGFPFIASVVIPTIPGSRKEIRAQSIRGILGVSLLSSIHHFHSYAFDLNPATWPSLTPRKFWKCDQRWPGLPSHSCVLQRGAQLSSRQFAIYSIAHSQALSPRVGFPSLWDLRTNDMRWSWYNNKVPNKRNALESSQTTPPLQSMQRLSSTKLVPGA